MVTHLNLSGRGRECEKEGGRVGSYWELTHHSIIPLKCKPQRTCTPPLRPSGKVRRMAMVNLPFLGREGRRGVLEVVMTFVLPILERRWV